MPKSYKAGDKKENRIEYVHLHSNSYTQAKNAVQKLKPKNPESKIATSVESKFNIKELKAYTYSVTKWHVSPASIC